ncbi:MAG: hypothetical protein ACNI27_07395 [Desulfovibrio sp.]
MAYNKAKMAILVAGMGGNSLFSYSTSDSLKKVAEDGYFTEAAKTYGLESGDSVCVSAGKDGCSEGAWLLVKVEEKKGEGQVATTSFFHNALPEAGGKAPKKTGGKAKATPEPDVADLE